MAIGEYRGKWDWLKPAPKGSPAGIFEEELRLDILGVKIKELRKSKNLTQEELGELIGVKKAQISKIENSFTNARFETILKVFKALDAKIKFSIEPIR